MNVVFDTDILSCIGKTEIFDLIKELFKGCYFVIPVRVCEELHAAKKIGYDFVDYIFYFIDKSEITVLPLTSEEIPKLILVEKNLNLDFGESEAIVLALRNNSLLLSNDFNVKKKCKSMDIEIFNLEDIILFAIEKCIINNTDELHRIISAIESKDRIKVRNKHYLIDKVSK